MKISLMSIAVAMVLVGCVKTDHSEVIVSVNGQELTKSALMRRVQMMDAIRRHRKASITDKQAGMYREKLMKSYPRVFAQNVVLDDYAAKAGIVLSDELLETFRQKAFLAFKTAKDRNFAAIKDSLGDLGDEFEAQVRSEALRQAIQDHLYRQNPTNLPPDYVEQQVAGIKAYNERMLATNRVTYIRATNVWTQLKSGANFKATAKWYTELPDERERGGMWGAVDRNQIAKDEPEIVKWGNRLGIGEFSPPIEADNGLMIMRIDDKRDNGNEFHISRIYFRLAQFYTPAKPEEMIKAAKEKHAKRLFDAKFAELMKAAAPVYHLERLGLPKHSDSAKPKRSGPFKNKANKENSK